MISLLFTIGWFLALALAAFGALLVLVFVALKVDEFLHGMPEYRQPRAQRVPPRPIVPAVPLRPFDRDDPLERQFALPSAPDPRRLV